MPMSLSLKPWALPACLAFVLAAPALGAASEYSGIVVFGTSLSDPGNDFVLRGGINHPPEYLLDALLVPGAPYARGGHHLSNGAPWIVQLARPLGLAGSVQAAYRGSSAEATNYAVDRARARNDGVNVNLNDQVIRFLQDVAGVAPPDRLYVLEIGSNDVFDAIRAGGDVSILQEALTSVSARLQELYAAGARRFLIADVPDVALTPAIRRAAQAQPEVSILASFLVQSFNTNLDAVVQQLRLLQGTEVARLEIYEKLYEIVADPEQFGLTNVTEACVMPDIPPYACRNPDEYLFWDGAHPTKAGHALFAQAALSALLQ